MNAHIHVRCVYDCVYTLSLLFALSLCEVVQGNYCACPPPSTLAFPFSRTLLPFEACMSRHPFSLFSWYKTPSFLFPSGLIAFYLSRLSLTYTADVISPPPHAQPTYTHTVRTGGRRCCVGVCGAPVFVCVAALPSSDWLRLAVVLLLCDMYVIFKLPPC